MTKLVYNTIFNNGSVSFIQNQTKTKKAWKFKPPMNSSKFAKLSFLTFVHVLKVLNISILWKLSSIYNRVKPGVKKKRISWNYIVRPNNSKCF